jgi:hypothetical protein
MLKIVVHDQHWAHDDSVKIVSHLERFGILSVLLT